MDPTSSTKDLTSFVMDAIPPEIRERSEQFMARTALEIEDELLEMGVLFSNTGAKNVTAHQTPGFDCLDYPHQSEASPPACASNCRICQAQFRPFPMQKSNTYMQYSEKYGDKEAEHIIQQLIATTKDNTRYINQKLNVYGNAIAKRWQNRNETQRLSSIRRALPELHHQKWMRAQFTRRLARPILEHIAKYTNHWLVPSLDAETLSEDPMHLLALLHYRSAFDPSSWVMFDSRELRAPLIHGIIKPRFNPHCVVMQGEGFGKLAKWDSELAHSWTIIGCPLAQLILEAQQKISDLLRRMIDDILRNSPHEIAEGCDVWKSLIAASFKAKGRQNCEALSAYCSQAFSPPPQFDMDLIVEKLLLRYKAAMDDIWLLQTDPAYMRQALAGVQNTAYYATLGKDMQLRQLFDQILKRLINLSRWRMTVNEALHLRKIWRKHAAQIRIANPLPTEYSEALRVLEYLLASQFCDYAMGLPRLANESSAFERHYSYIHNGGDELNLTGCEAFRKDPLYWNVHEIRPHDDPIANDPWFHFVFIADILSKATKNERSKLDEVLYDRLTDMAAIDEVFSAVRCHRPRPVPLKSFDHLIEHLDKRPWNDMFNTLLDGVKELGQSQLENVLGPFKTMLKSKIPNGKIDDNTMTAFDESHRTLSAFWTAFELALRESLLTVECLEENLGVLLYDLSASSEKRYKEQLESERDEIKNAVEARSQRSRPSDRSAPPKSDQAAVLQTYWGKTAGRPILFDSYEDNLVETLTLPALGSYTSAERKPKVKTRPSNADDFVTDSNEAEDAELVQGMQSLNIEPRLAVTSASAHLLSRMFAAYGVQKGFVKWDDFVGAMADAGFSATHSGGSSVTFKDETNATGSIVFHRPHPDPSLDSVKLRSFGKRLTKWFGWNEDTFVERCKHGGC